MNVHPQTPEAYRFMHEGALALARATETGMRVDMEYCVAKHAHMKRQIDRLRTRLEDSEIFVKWRDIYGKDTNWDSTEQMADIIYNHLGYEPTQFTESGKPSTSQAALESLKLPDVQDIIRMGRLTKGRDTFLAGIIRESVQYPTGDWYLHPFFHLNVAQTFRSSSSSINFQNLPKRVKEIMQAIRASLIPRPGFQLGEIDFSGAEIRGAYCYHRDPAMYDEITNPSRDMHRDMAMECYLLTLEEMGMKGSPVYKILRHCGKNKFVFAEFYGDFYESVALALWEEIELQNLKTAQGVPLKQHLKSKGIWGLPSFVDHIKTVEDRFWKDRFPVYASWKKKQIKFYEAHGYVDLVTGFRCYGPMRRNQAINYPIQGASFHMLLWSFTRLMEISIREGWRSKLVGQIHDSIVFDLHPDERDYVLRTAQRVMTEDLPRAWKWIKVPLEVEADVGEIGASWNEVKPYTIIQ